ncbi:hypothetical protein [Hymenobacter daeguensis]
MNTIKQRIAAVLLLAGVGCAGWAYYRTQVQQGVLLNAIGAMDAALTTNNRQSERQAGVTVRVLAKEVCRNYMQARDVAVLSESQQILSRSQALTDTLRALRRQLQATGKAIDLPELVRHLDRYSDFIHTYVPYSRYLTREFPGPPDPNWLGRTYFEKVPLEATWATLTKLEALVRRNERDALNTQAQKVGSCCMYFNWISAHAVPASASVAPGGEYQARLFLNEAVPLHRSNMQFTANGQTMPMDSIDALGHVAFAVPPAVPGQPDTVRAQWRGTVRLQMCPTDTVFEVDVPYLIVKPRP